MGNIDKQKKKWDKMKSKGKKIFILKELISYLAISIAFPTIEVILRKDLLDNTQVLVFIYLLNIFGWSLAGIINANRLWEKNIKKFEK